MFRYWSSPASNAEGEYICLQTFLQTQAALAQCLSGGCIVLWLSPLICQWRLCGSRYQSKKGNMQLHDSLK
jgi:hypothetical protein